jgi:hypothetical protein
MAESTAQPNGPEVADIGITEIYPAGKPLADQNIVADVVFVHVLMGHPVKTWLRGELPSPLFMKRKRGEADTSFPDETTTSRAQSSYLYFWRKTPKGIQEPQNDQETPSR